MASQALRNQPFPTSVLMIWPWSLKWKTSPVVQKQLVSSPACLKVGIICFLIAKLLFFVNPECVSFSTHLFLSSEKELEVDHLLSQSLVLEAQRKGMVHSLLGGQWLESTDRHYAHICKKEKLGDLKSKPEDSWRGCPLQRNARAGVNCLMWEFHRD